MRGTHRTDLFMEVTNFMKGNTVWAHFTLTGYYSTSIKLSRQIPKEKVHIDTSCCCFKMMHIDWDNTVVTGISGIKIEIPTEAKVSIFTNNDLTHINDDHFEINLVACLLNQIYVVPNHHLNMIFVMIHMLMQLTNQFWVLPQVQQPQHLCFHLQHDELYINGL